MRLPAPPTRYDARDQAAMRRAIESTAEVDARAGSTGVGRVPLGLFPQQLTASIATGAHHMLMIGPFSIESGVTLTVTSGSTVIVL